MSSNVNKSDRLPDAGLLAALPPLLSGLARRGVIRQYRADTTLIEEGDNDDTIFVVLSGSVRIFCSDGSGKEITLAVYGPGEYVGEMSLDGGLRSASVTTETITVCSIVSNMTLRAYIAEHPQFALDLIRRLIRRTRLATASARSLALFDSYGRIKQLFDNLAEARADGKRLVSERLTHMAIAQRIGCTRELVSRLLKELETGGFILTENRHYVLLQELPVKW